MFCDDELGIGRFRFPWGIRLRINKYVWFNGCQTTRPSDNPTLDNPPSYPRQPALGGLSRVGCGGTDPGNMPIWAPYGQNPGHLGHLGKRQPIQIPYVSHMCSRWVNPYKDQHGHSHMGIILDTCGQTHVGMICKYPYGYHVGKVWATPYG